VFVHNNKTTNSKKTLYVSETQKQANTVKEFLQKKFNIQPTQIQAHGLEGNVNKKPCTSIPEHYRGDCEKINRRIEVWADDAA
jgi:hypothetical protein